jgi:DNA-binding transcriptional LysR family regulator
VNDLIAIRDSYVDAADLRVFAAVARTGGINKAARALNTVQSNVTQRVRALEGELGVALFRRHSRGVTLTDAGAQLLPYAERIGPMIEEARRAATERSLPAGRLVIGSLESTAARRLPPILSAYAKDFPQVDIVLETGTTAELIARVLDRRLEGAFVAAPVDHSDLVADRVVTEELVLLSAPGVASVEALVKRAARKEVEFKALVLRAGCSYRQRLEEILAARGLSQPRLLEFGMIDGIVGCIAAGIGVTLLPRAVVERPVKEGRIKAHRLPRKEALVDTLFVRRRDAFVSSALARFIERACRLDTHR